MPLRLGEHRHAIYAYVILSYGHEVRVWAYSGNFSLLDFAIVVGSHAQSRPCTLPGSIYCWTWNGPARTLRTVMQSDACCSCAHCHARVADQHVQQCANCHFFRYCSRRCSKAHWKTMHKDMCGPIASAYNRFDRRHSQYDVAYGYIDAAEFALWEHLLHAENRP